MKYTYNDGRVVEFEDFDIPDISAFYFKVNLPSTLGEFMSGNGEGVWACGDNETYEDCINDVEDGVYFVKILNDSVYYPPLVYGTVVAVEFRGDCRPVALFKELQTKYGESHKDKYFK